MGNELKDYKLYFKMEKDEGNGWKELNNTVEEIKKDMVEKMIEATKILEYSFDFNLTDEQIKKYKKLIGESPLSKKRTRKLLMAHGFDRDTAQMYADTMKPRNMNAIKELIKIKEEYIDE